MPIHGFGIEFFVVLVVALLIFGPKKLPEMGSAIGKSIKEFKKGMNELSQGKDKEDEPKTPSTLSYEALERELASRRAADAARSIEEFNKGFNNHEFNKEDNIVESTKVD